jgi:hypothetical protein
MIAVFTVYRDEHYFLPIWKKYYESQDFDTVLAIEDKHPVAFDHNYLTEFVRSKQRELLKTHEVVVYTDVDEIIISKQHSTLGSYCRNIPVKTIKTTGYEVVGNKWVRYNRMDKPLISSVPLNWEHGYHGCPEHSVQDAELILLHLHRYNYEACKQRHKDRAKMNWDKIAVDTKLSFQNRIHEDAEFESWYHEDRDRLEDMPKELKEVLDNVV